VTHPLATCLVFSAVLCLAAGGCGRKDATPSKQPEAPGSVETKVARKPKIPRFCVMAVRVEVVAHPATRLSPTVLREPIAKMLADLPHVAGLKDKADQPEKSCAKTASRDEKVGILLQITATLRGTDGKEVPANAPASAGQMHIKTTVHAERGDENGRPEIGLSSMQAAVPVTARHIDKLDRFSAVRVVRAAAFAASDALGQLAVRHVDDATVRGYLASDTVWQRVAAVREVGERGIEEELEAIHEAARSSRKDIALVAIATLGRLGKKASVDVLIEALDRPAVAVIDAALVALADIGDGRAVEAITRIAKTHPAPWVRRRARSLLRMDGK